MVHYTNQIIEEVSNICDVSVIGQKSQSQHFSKKVNFFGLLRNVPGGLSVINFINIISFINLIKIKKINPDIIHVTIPNPLTAFFLIPLRNYPIILTIHEPYLHEGFDPYEILIDFSYKIFFRISDKIFVHCNKAKQILLKRGVTSDKVEIVPHGDYSFFTKYDKKFQEKKNSMLFFGHIRKYKGLKYLIKAVPLISKEIPDIKLIIAGDGDLSRYEELINDKNRFEIINKYVPDEITSELFQIAEIVVLPYIQATESGVLKIAYAFKKPVIVTDVGCIPEAVDHEKTGLIIPPKDPEALSNAIIKLLKNKELGKEMGKNGHRKMKKEFSWEKIAKSTIEIYETTIKKRVHKQNEND